MKLYVKSSNVIDNTKYVNELGYAVQYNVRIELDGLEVDYVITDSTIQFYEGSKLLCEYPTAGVNSYRSVKPAAIDIYLTIADMYSPDSDHGDPNVWFTW